MSIQPNRVLSRIVLQVDASDWPRLASSVSISPETGECLRIYRAPTDERYATPLHFWTHALREELNATGRRRDLVGAAGHALCRRASILEWLGDVRDFAGLRSEQAEWLDSLSDRAQTRPDDFEVYRMLESECRRSSVVGTGAEWVAHFWGHGGGPSWRREGCFR